MEVKYKKELLIFLVCLLFFKPVWGSQDHSKFLKGPFKTGEEITKACLECHEKEANDFIKTSHWRWKGVPRTIASKENFKEEYGKSNLLNNFCISIEGGDKCSNSEFCTKCHPGYGWKDNTFDFNNKEKIDCLICHAREGNYQKGLSGEPDRTLMERGIMSLTKAVKSVGKPKRENCGVCHFYGGGGEGVKNGDLDSALIKPSRDHDLHMGGVADMTCQECHVTQEHKISGASTFLATNEGRISCEDCHRKRHAESKSEKILNKHLKTVACQTCHIPYFAKAKPTKMRWDWSTVGKDIEPEEQYGRETYAKHKGTFEWGMNVIPTYEWYNGKIKRYLKGDKIEDPKGIVYISKPVGDIKDLNSKIYPFKVHRGKQPMDSVYKYLLIPKLYKGLWSHYDWDKALVEGALGSKLPFSGKYEFVEMAMYGSINHEVEPKEKALRCDECHMGGKRLNWKALGYKGDPMKYGTRFDLLNETKKVEKKKN